MITPNRKGAMLTPFNTKSKEEQKAIFAKGGKAKSDKKTLAITKNGAKFAKCKKCKLPCFLREEHLAKNPEQLCTIPEARGNAVFYHCAPMNEEILNKLSTDTIQIMAASCKDVKDLAILHNAIMKRKEHDYPKELKIKHTGMINIETNLVKALADKLKEEEEKAGQ